MYPGGGRYPGIYPDAFFAGIFFIGRYRGGTAGRRPPLIAARVPAMPPVITRPAKSALITIFMLRPGIGAGGSAFFLAIKVINSFKIETHRP